MFGAAQVARRHVFVFLLPTYTATLTTIMYLELPFTYLMFKIVCSIYAYCSFFFSSLSKRYLDGYKKLKDTEIYVQPKTAEKTF